jgi:hypothetical protein
MAAGAILRAPAPRDNNPGPGFYKKLIASRSGGFTGHSGNYLSKGNYTIAYFTFWNNFRMQ